MSAKLLPGMLVYQPGGGSLYGDRGVLFLTVSCTLDGRFHELCSLPGTSQLTGLIHGMLWQSGWTTVKV